MTDCVRPWCCPEPRCTPIHNGGVSENPTPGVSFMCWGYLADAIKFEYDGARHANDLSSCWYTALKGVIRWQENVSDWMNTVADYWKALEKLPLSVLVRCEPTIRHRLLEKREVDTGDVEGE